MNVIALFAHPDDETMLAGGCLALLAQAGVGVDYLCATRGEGGEVGEPPLCTPEQLGEVRAREMDCAVHVLGARSLTFLGYDDPRIGPDEQLFPYTDDLTALAGQIAAFIRQFDADAVISHGSNGEYGHPAHILTFQAAAIAVRSFEENAPLLYTVQAAFPEHPKPRLANPDDPAHLVLDVTPVLPKKEQAAFCHRTQHALFVRRSSQKAGRQVTVPEVIMKTESLHRAYPPVEGDLNDPLAETLKPYSINAASLTDEG
jgi:LmbE family N-acetylglucosaminyl deacetylase